MPKRKTTLRFALLGLSVATFALAYFAPDALVSRVLKTVKWGAMGGFLLFELAVVAWIFRWVFRETAEESERRISGELRWLPEGVVRSLLMTEVRVWLYGLKRSRPGQWEGVNFSYAAQGDNAQMQKIFIFLMLIELPIAHFFLGFIVSDFWRWVIFFLSMYAAFWLFAEWRATKLRPISVLDEAVHVRYGVMHSFVIQLKEIERVSSASIVDAHQYPVKLVGFGAPNVGLELNVPVQTVFGRSASKLALGLDQPGQFIDLLRERLRLLESQGDDGIARTSSPGGLQCSQPSPR
ncbi:hypothetical protein [Lysobacter fragariae]